MAVHSLVAEHPQSSLDSCLVVAWHGHAFEAQVLAHLRACMQQVVLIIDISHALKYHPFCPVSVPLTIKLSCGVGCLACRASCASRHITIAQPVPCKWQQHVT
eukprot:364426-Chlamydomonas_euryale.AAC.15